MNTNLITVTFVVGLLAASVRLATPILLAALGEVFTERAGILNLGLEGIMLMGALSGFLGAYLSGSLWVGVLVALLIGMLFGLLMAFLSVTARVNQVVAGIGITILGSGLSTLLFRLFFGLRSVPPMVASFPNQPIPLLGQVPVLGTVFFDHNILVYLSLALVPAASLLLYRTRFGLAVRAVGEKPQAADARGISVAAVRYLSTILGGGLAGIGGAFLPLGYLGLFWTQMTAGRGFIAIAVVIFARWDPLRALLGSVIFGGTMALQLAMQTLNVPVPSECLQMLPYVITILALVAVSRRAEFPGAFTLPYEQGGA